ncbi:MAG: transposase [Polyangiaceae bacterium]
MHAMWQDAFTASVLSTDATGAAIQPGKREQSRVQQACKRGHFFTVVADCDHVLFYYTEKHDHATVKELFGEYRGFLQADASNVYDILERGPPTEGDEDKLKFVDAVNRKQNAARQPRSEELSQMRELSVSKLPSTARSRRVSSGARSDQNNGYPYPPD